MMPPQSHDELILVSRRDETHCVMGMLDGAIEYEGYAKWSVDSWFIYLTRS